MGRNKEVGGDGHYQEMNTMITSTIWDMLFAVQCCRNWREIVRSLIANQIPERVILKDGTTLRSPENPLFIIREIYFERVYNPPELEIRSGDLVIDIGANVGIFSTFAAARSQRQVYAFEPLPLNCQFLKQNMADNRLSQITPVCSAVSAHTGTVKLYTTQSPSGNLLFNHNVQGKIEQYIEVSSTTLSAIMEEYDLQTIDFMKMDCEGAEGEILQSTPPEHLRRVNKLAMEFHDNVSSLKHSEIQHLLEQCGFKTACRWNGRSPFGYLYAWQPA
jgi:FkbM family methyltransferase